MTHDPSAPLPRQFSSGNSGPTAQVGGDNVGGIHITHRLRLPAFPVPEPDRAAATDPLWAYTPTPQRAADLLAAHGLAVIVGKHGTGRRTSAVRAVQTRLLLISATPQLFDLAADWEDDETPGQDVLPQPAPGCGYLIDAASRPLTPAASLALTAWAEQLQAAGSCLVITGNESDWQGDSRFEIPAVRPDAIQVARNHLAERFPAQAHWLQPDPNQIAPRGGLLRGPAAPDPTAGALSD